ncbi:hypothetical protein V6N13_036821 [Hibiscus sabdariffa]
MLTNEGQWNWNYLRRWLPTEILDSIATVPPSAAHYGADTPGWRWSDKREFSVGSAYSVLMGTEAQDRNSKWREVWSLKVPQHVQIFMWLTTHGHHLTNIERTRRHLVVSNRCTLCYSGSEDMDHVLRFCTCARELWNVVIKQEVLSQFYDLPYDDWLRVNLLGSGIMAGLSVDWSMHFSIYFWLLWKQRCCMIFDVDHVDRDSVLAKGQRLISECEVIASSRTTPSTVVHDNAIWEGPEREWIKGVNGRNMVALPLILASVLGELILGGHFRSYEVEGEQSSRCCSR